MTPGVAAAAGEPLVRERRLDRAGTVPARCGQPDTPEAILRERARRLSVAAARTDSGATVQVLECRLGAEQYALEMRLLHGVQRATGLTPVPGAPASVTGLLNVRGEIVAVLDLAIALALERSGPPQAEGRNVLLVELSGVRVGLLVDEVVGVQTLALNRLERAPSGSDVARGVAEARIVLLDLERLLADGRFDVAEELG